MNRGPGCAAAVATVLLSAACSRSAPPPPADPNILLVTLDTTRADRIGAFGGTAVPTPNLDAIAREGVRFDEASSQVPLTLPSHATILTGRYPASHGVRHNGMYRLREAETTLAERFRDAGLETAAFVGAFVLNRQYGTAQGFETYDDIAVDRYQGGRDVQFEAQRTADEVNASVLDWLGRRKPGRFFAWVHYYDPHLPYRPPENTAHRLAGSGYDREISYVDACFGDLVAALRASGLLDSTILVVAGDHGESLGEHREVSHGVFLYEGPLRVPMMIRAPGRVPAGEVVHGPVGLVDLAPTILELAGMGPTPGMEGRSLLPRVLGRENAADGVVFAETWMPRIEFGWSELRMVRDGRYKYILAPRPELYDLEDDPKEERNLLGADPERAAEMAAILGTWVAATATTGAKAEREARSEVSPDELARLRSLGYLAGGASAGEAARGAALPDPKDRIDEGWRLTEARDRLLAGDAEGALREFDDLLRRSPGNHLAHASRLQALVRLRRLPDAETEARAALALALADGNAAPALVEKSRRALASVLWMVGKNGEAEKEYRLAVESGKTSDSAPVFGGILLGAAGGREEALRIVSDALSKNPRDGMAMAARFELEAAAGDASAALRSARSLADLGAGDADTLVRAGKLAARHDDPALAAKLFALAAGKLRDDPDVLGYLGTSRLATGDLNGAEAALLDARRLTPKDPRPPFYLGNIALLRNDEALARARFAEALGADPKFTPPLHNLAAWLADKRRVGEAIATLEEALRRRPEDVEAREMLKRLDPARGGGS